MADEQSQRPYRASEPPLRSHARTANNDPLAELARLIGQTDPFGEFGRDTARRSVAPAERSDRNTQATGSSYAPQSETDWRGAASQRSEGNGYYGARGAVGEQGVPVDYDGDQSYGRQSYGGASDAARDDAYQADHEAHGYTCGANRLSVWRPTSKMRLSILRTNTTMNRLPRAGALGLWRLPVYLLWL